MFTFTTLLPEKEERMFKSYYSDYKFKKTFDEVMKRYDIVDLAKKANEKREEIQKNNFIYSGWEVFDGAHFNTNNIDSEGWTVRKYKKPIYPVRSEWIESICDSLLNSESENIPFKNGFSGILNIRKFRKIINPMSEENITRSVTVTSIYNDKKTLIALSLPCDYIFDNWWMRLFYEIRSLEYLNEYKNRFIQNKWSERIAYTLYIYRFRYPLYMWSVAQKYVMKKYCKKLNNKTLSKKENIICDVVIDDQKPYIPTLKDIKNDICDMLDVEQSDINDDNVNNKSKSIEDNAIEKEGANVLFGN